MNTSTPRCERCSSILASDDLRCPICNLTCAVPAFEDRSKTVVDILRCTGCGAAMTYEVARRSAACAFCGSAVELEHPEDPMEEARHLVPFTVDAGTARQTFAAWLGSLGWFRPGDLTTEARLETIQPLRWVAWVFDAQAEVSWAADTDADSHRSDWAPHSGQVELEYDDVVVPATRGLELDEVATLLAGYDLGSITDEGDVVDDAVAERFDVPRSTARARLIEAVDRLARRRLSERHLPGRRVRNLHISTVLRGLEVRRVTFPAWVLAYRYKKRLYRTVLSGQDATRLEGDAPYSAFRIAVVVAGAGAVVVALLALIAI